MSRAYGAGSFLGSPYQKVEYLIGRENGTTRAGLVSSPAGFHGTWVHPNPGQPVELNVICVGAGGGGAGGLYSFTLVAQPSAGENGTKTIFGAITANAGNGGGEYIVENVRGRGGDGLVQGLSGSYSQSSSTQNGGKLGIMFNAGDGGDSASGYDVLHGGGGGSGYIALTGSYTVIGNIDYIIGAGGLGGINGAAARTDYRLMQSRNGGDGLIILQYNSTN